MVDWARATVGRGTVRTRSVGKTAGDDRLILSIGKTGGDSVYAELY